MNLLKKFFFYSEEQVKERELQGKYSYENGVKFGVKFGFQLGVILTILISKIFNIIFL